MMDAREEQTIRQAIENSKIETKICDTIDIAEVKTFWPTQEEFADPIRYVESITAEGEKYGIVKIVPPNKWDPPSALDLTSQHPFPTRKQSLRFFQQGTGFDEGRDFTVAEYQCMAQHFYESWVRARYRDRGIRSGPSYEDLERDYWRIIETQEDDVMIEYANDLDTQKLGSGFPGKWGGGEGGIEGIGGRGEADMADRRYYEQCGWNLQNLPMWPGSVLRYIHAPLNGVNVPWLYMGMLFATFCWHNEDNFSE